MEAKVYRAQDPEIAQLAAQVEEAHLVPGQIEHELDWVTDSDHGQRASAGVLGLFDDRRLAGYVPFRYREDGLLLRLAGVRLGRVPYRVLELFGRGVVANEDHVVPEALSRLDALPLAFHAVAVHEVPIESPLWKAVREGAAENFHTIERERGVHHVVDLPRSFDEYMARFSSKTRSTWKRKARKLESEVGPLQLRVYTRPEEVTDLLSTVEPVSRLTYHYHLLGRNLSPTNLQLVANMRSWARRSWLRGYVLFAGDRAVAYVIGCVSRRRYSYDLPGYDPRRSADSPGIILLLRMIQEMIEADVADVLDFGGGHADYKEQLGTRSFDEASALLVRRTPYAQGVANLQRGLTATVKLGAGMLDRLSLKARMRHWLRGRKLRAA